MNTNPLMAVWSAKKRVSGSLKAFWSSLMMYSGKTKYTNPQMMKYFLSLFLVLPFLAFGQTQDPCYSVNDVYLEIEEQNPPLSKDLSTGWNLIGFPCVESIDAELAFSSIVDKVVIIKDNNGDVYMPEWGFNGIGELTKLNGYQIKLNDFVIDFSFCSPLTIPQVEGCTDCESLNFNQWATVDDESCNYDTDGDGVNDADEIVGCLDVLACNFDNVAYATDNGGCEFPVEGFNCWGNELSANIGDTVYGGIVFYIDSTGQHGLVAALSDLEEQYQWGCYLEVVEGADGIEIGTGLQNTIDIVNSNCMLVDYTSELIEGSTVYTYSEPYEGQTAAGAAYEHESGGYDDWYLPSKLELYEMYSEIGQGSEIGNVGEFSSSAYWSSSEFNYNYAWHVYFGSGYAGSLGKASPRLVRIIRAF